MNFEDFKRVAKPGDLIAVSHQTWGSLADVESQIVRIVTESEYSHVCVVLDNDGDTPHILEAVVPAVTANPASRYLDYGFYFIPTPDKPMSDAERAYGHSKIGQAYSKVEAVEGDLNLLDIGASDKWQCSELTIAMRRFSALDLGPHATPAAVVQKALSLGYTLHYITKD
jgi:hypothetical protein